MNATGSISVFNTTSDSFVSAALWAGAISLLLTAIVGISIIALRVALRRAERLEKATVEKWRPILNATLIGEPPDTLPSLRKNEELDFLKLLVYFQTSLRGEARVALNDLGYRLDCDRIATHLLDRGNDAEQLLGILALGHMRVESALPSLRQHANSSDAAISSHAFWAILQTDASLAPALVPEFFVRDDLPLSQLANILKEADFDCTAILSESLGKVDAQHIPRLLRLAESLRIQLPDTQIRALMNRDEINIIIAALRLASSPLLLLQARKFLHSDNWRVRLHAVRAIGKIGDRSDIERLKPLLQDKEWWVRYRTAETLVDMPFVSRDDLGALVSAPDRFARDIVTQVLAERGMQ